MVQVIRRKIVKIVLDIIIFQNLLKLMTLLKTQLVLTERGHKSTIEEIFLSFPRYTLEEMQFLARLPQSIQ